MRTGFAQPSSRRIQVIFGTVAMSVVAMIGYTLWPAGQTHDSQLIELNRRLAVGAAVGDFPELERLADEVREVAEFEAYVYHKGPLGYQRQTFKDCLVYSITFDDHSEEGLVGFDVVVRDGQIVAWREDVLIR